MTDQTKNLCKFIIVIFSIAVGVVGAFVLRDLWGWYAVPALGVHPITVLQAYGLGIIYWMFAFVPTDLPKYDTPQEELGTLAGKVVVRLFHILISWGIGWTVLKLFG